MEDQPTLTTQRLVLRPLDQSDASRVQELAGDSRIAATTKAIPHPHPDGLAESWISTHPEHWQNGSCMTCAVVEAATGSLVGVVGLMEIGNSEAELGYWIGVPYWRKGYCSEAAQVLVEYAFQALPISRIHAVHLSSNPASGRVLRKTGFRHTRRLFEASWKGQGAVDVEEYELIGR